jgi:hypothetical protein
MCPMLRSRIIFMRLRLRVKVLMRLRLRVKILMRLQLRLRLLPYSIARQNFWNELKFKHMLKLSCSFDSVQFVLLKIWTEWVINYKLFVIFQYLTMFNTIVGAAAVGAGSGAASRYGSGSDQMMRLLAAPAPQHCIAIFRLRTKKLLLS